MILPLLAETTGHTDAKAAFPPFETWHMAGQLFWLAVFFVMLYVALSRFILPKISDTIEKRANRIASGLDEAARLNNQAIEAQKSLDLKLAQARAKARETADKARAKSAAELASETARVDAELSKKLSAEDARIERLRNDAMSKVEGIATDTAEFILGRFGVKAQKAELRKAVTSALE